MIHYGKKDMFDLDVDCIVNTVNCRVDKLYERQARNPDRFKTAQLGVAAAFEKRFPDSQPPLIKACKTGQMKPGMVLPVSIDKKTGRRVASGEGDLVIAHASTKDDWKSPSELEWARSCAQKLAKLVEMRDLKSIAIPPLGAGMGKLEWKDVQREIHTAMEPLAKKGVQVFVLGDDELGLSNERGAKEASSDEAEFTYAGIGSRKAAKNKPVWDKMKRIGEIMGEAGIGLRSGGADGADDAFEKGAIAVDGPKKIFLASKNFNGRTADGKDYIHDNNPKLLEMASKYHPAWNRLGDFAKKLMGRNCQQAMGKDLDKPANLVMAYTPSGKPEGGTGQALRIADDKKIPVINVGAAPWKDLSAEKIAEAAIKVVRRQATLDDVTKEHQGAKSSYIVIGDER
jgi:O-acetyl-ADP-ribose deacetylase (regulator of RNase III)